MAQEEVKAKRTARKLTQLEIMGRIEKLIVGLDNKGIEYMSGRLQEVYAERNSDASNGSAAPGGDSAEQA